MLNRPTLVERDISSHQTWTVLQNERYLRPQFLCLGNALETCVLLSRFQEAALALLREERCCLDLVVLIRPIKHRIQHLLSRELSDCSTTLCDT